MAFAKTYFFLAFTALLCFSGCEEIPPKLTLIESGGGTGSNELSTQQRGILIEEFTGVRCVNCPAGAEAIAQLKEIYQERLIPVSLHTGFFANPYPESLIDFRTNDADAQETFIGAPQGYPSAVINRKRFQGEPGLQLGRASWAGYIAQELSAEPAIAIGLTTEFNDANGDLSIDVELLGRTGTDGRVSFLTVQILESKIEDVQLTPEGKKADYLHEHALRKAVTSPLGESIGAFTPGQTFSKSFTSDIPGDYNPAQIEVVAFVHYADADEGGKEVLQAVGAKIK